MYIMLLEGFYPQDIRVRKEAESMAAEGFDVMVITPWQKGLAREELINGVKIKRIGIHYSFNVKGILDIINSLFFINWMFYFSVNKLRKQINIKTIHFHDLPLIKTSLILARKIKCPFIFDMHENYPEMIEEYRLSNKTFFKKLKDRLFFGVKRWKRFENIYISKPDHIVVVVDEMKEKLIHDFQINPKKVTIVSNFEKLTFSSTIQKDNFNFDNSTFYLAYIGGISPFRGLDVVIKAIHLLKLKGFSVQFLILGSGNQNYIDELKRLTHSLKVKDNVLFLGQKPFEVVNYYMKNVNLNIIPHIKNNHTDYTIPHKLFQIFLSQAPIIVSSCKPLKRYVEQMDGGFVYEADDSSDLANQIETIAQMDHKIVLQKVKNAFEYTKENLSWEQESSKLIALYKKFHGE